MVLSQVVELRLDSRGLSGPLPASFSAFKKLKTLEMRNNQLTGLLPDFIWQSGDLEKLRVSKNKFNVRRTPLHTGRGSAASP